MIYNNPYMDMFYKSIRSTGNRRKGVKVRDTCPICKRTLVNIYKQDNTWKCKKCWDKTNEWREDQI